MKYAVVTGSTKGIGRAIAEKLLQAGYFVVVNYASDDVSAEEFVQCQEAYRGRIALVKKDLSSYMAACEFVREIEPVCSYVDVLVLNSGTTDRTPFGRITWEGWQQVMNVNLNVPFFLTQMLGGKICTDTGSIIFTGSLMGEMPHAGSISYGVSKAGLHALVRYLVKYFSKKGITVNGIVSGFADTPWQNDKSCERRKRIEDKIALGRFARPEEIAALCMHVIGNRYINGSLLHIDGGYCYE